MNTWEIEVYETTSGKRPYEDWLDGLDNQTVARIQKRLDRIEQGNFGDHASVGDSISELRLDFGPGYRIYYTTEGNKVVILMTAGDKSTQSADIKQAKTYLQDYRSRENDA